MFLRHLKVGVVDQNPYTNAVSERVIDPKKLLVVNMLSTQWIMLH